jgi:RNA polymerase sigma-70 factor, ECF subfamily
MAAGHGEDRLSFPAALALTSRCTRSDDTVAERVLRAYEAHRLALYRYLLMLGLAADRSEDLCQESFLRYFGALQKNTSIRDERAWLFRTTHNLAMDQHDAQAVRSRNAADWLDAAVEQVADPERGPEARLLHRERFARLHRAVQSLSPQQKQCLLLRAEGFRYREIADITGLRLSTVAEFLRRAVARLRKAVL